SGSDAGPYFMPGHLFFALRESKVDRELFSVPVQRTVGIRVEIASSRARIVAKQPAQVVGGFVPPMKCDKEHLLRGSAHVFLFDQNVSTRTYLPVLSPATSSSGCRNTAGSKFVRRRPVSLQSFGKTLHFRGRCIAFGL